MESEPSHVYRIVTQGEWKKFQEEGKYNGAAIDEKDGFIHLSTKEQCQETAALFFKGQDIVVLELAVEALKPDLKWDPVAERDGELFPHLYAPSIPLSAVTKTISSMLKDDKPVIQF